jgi:nicotinamidase-related amidase
MMKPRLLQPENVCLQVIDVQQSLMAKVDRSEMVAGTVALMIECAGILDIPIIANTQYKKGLGLYPPNLETLVQGLPRFDKVEFSAAANKQTADYIAGLPGTVTTIALVGVESHICIYQTAVGLMAMGKEVWIVSDGVSSRKAEDHQSALERLLRLGASVGPAEMLIYELLAKAGSPRFKAVLPLILARK